MFIGLTLIHLLNTPHVVRELSHLVLIGDMGWKLFAPLTAGRKDEVCQHITLRGQTVLPAKNAKCFIGGRCTLTLETLIEALQDTGVNQVCLYAYGIKVMDSSFCLIMKDYTLPRYPVASCR